MPTAPMIPKIPPLRTDIQEPQQSSAVNRPPAQGASNGANTASSGNGPQHRTSKEWYYYWSKVGERVVENTQKLNGLVTYGTHAARPDPSTMPDGALTVESDRGAIYQNELIQGVPTWWYIAGTMWGTMSPDQRPADLGVHDAGFDFRTTDQPPREFIWSGGAWVETTPPKSNSILYAPASAALTLTTSPQPVPGTTLSLNIAGNWLVMGNFYFAMDPPDSGASLIGNLNPIQTAYAIIRNAGTVLFQANVQQNWVLNISSIPTSVNLTAYKTAGSGASSAASGWSTITAVFIN